MLPRNDLAFRATLQNFLTVVQANLATLGLQATDIAPCSTASDSFSTDLEEHILQQSMAQQATQKKETSKKAVREKYRSLVKLIESKATLTDALRDALGLAIPDQPRTPAHAPESSPLLIVSGIERYQHTLKIVNSENTTTTAKPSGVIGTEVYLKIGTAPAGPSDPELKFVGLSTTGKLTVNFDAADAGKTAWYIGTYLGSRGSKSPVSETVSATIAA